MPHITVKPFDTSLLESKKYAHTEILFRAKDINRADELIGVEVDRNRFLLHLKKGKGGWVFKYDKVTRPLDVNLIKRALADISQELKLDILNSNITIRKTKIANEYEKRIGDFESIKFPFETVYIEVGFGSGKHILYQAVSNPNKLFIGIEIHTPSAQQLLRQIELRGLKNIWVVNYDARLLLEMIPSNRVSKIFVHFPVPWDKKPHRRVISSSFLEEAMRVLERGGKLELRTDSPKYFWYSMELFLGDEVSQTLVEIRKNSPLEIVSKYEARWRREQKDIYDIFVTSQELSEERSLNFSFSFTGVKYRDELLAKISQSPLLFKDSFIHFERIYRIDTSTILLKLSFGSFDRPEHKYIHVNGDGASYFGEEPVQTPTNHRVHQKIEEYLNV